MEEGGDAPPAPPADDTAADAEVEVPEALSLLWFLQRKELSDCGVRLPPTSAVAPPDDAAEGGGEVVPCHRLALCSGSKFFYRRLLGAAPDAASEGGPVVELPPLPDDEALRKQIDVHAVFPLVLRFLYAAQRWEEIEAQVSAQNAMGVFALGQLLEIDTLSRHAFGYIESSVLGPEQASKLLYASVLLQGAGRGGFDGPATKCAEVLRATFHELADRPEDMDLLAKLPVSVLGPILEADDLEVPAEANVLRVAQQVLRGRMSRSEVVLKITDAKLFNAPEALQTLKRAAGGVVWEALIVEDPLQRDFAALAAARADAPKYLAATAASKPQETGSGGCDVAQELSLRVPVASVGPGKPGSVLLRARGATGEVLLAGALPAAALPAAGGDAATLAEAPMQTASGKPGGAVRFSWRSEPLEAPPPPPPEGEEAAAEAAPGEEASPAAGAEAALSDDEAARILAAVRFPHLEHRELLAAVKDPVLLEAGAQQRILEALSSRLDAYEHAGEDQASQRQEPRPSTLRGGPKDAASLGRRGAGASPPKRPQPPPPAAKGGPEAQRPLPGGGGGALGAARRSLSASRRRGGGVSGHPLFQCGSCGSGSLVLRQRDLRWCVECSRYPSCLQALQLPTCIMAAAVDGHCAVCTLRLGTDVRTLTVRVGREHSATLLRLPEGMDTLRGMCVAGCSDTLALLGA